MVSYYSYSATSCQGCNRQVRLIGINVTIPTSIFFKTRRNKCRSGSRAAASSKMERFLIIVNGWKPLAIITKRSILDVVAALDPPLKWHERKLVYTSIIGHVLLCIEDPASITFTPKLMWGVWLGDLVSDIFSLNLDTVSSRLNLCSGMISDLSWCFGKSGRILH